MACTTEQLKRAKDSGDAAACGGAHFPGSRLLTAEWGGTLSGWAGKGEGLEWVLCCSTFEGCDTGAKFHAACDAHAPTLTVAHHAGDGGSNYTFGGFVRPLDPEAPLAIFSTLVI